MQGECITDYCKTILKEVSKLFMLGRVVSSKVFFFILLNFLISLSRVASNIFLLGRCYRSNITFVKNPTNKTKKHLFVRNSMHFVF